MPRTMTVHLLTGDYADRLNQKWAEAQAALDDKTPATALEGDSYARIEAEYKALKNEALEAGITVNLAAVGRSVWRSLKVKFPPRTGEDFDPETVKLDRANGINADAVEDDLVYLSVKAWEQETGESVPYVSTRAAFDEWADKLSEGEWQTLTIRAWELANGARLDPKELPSLPTRSDG